MNIGLRDIETLGGQRLDRLCARLDVYRERREFSVRPLWAWYDLWIGAFWDRDRRRLYVMFLPTLGLVVQMPWVEPDADLRARAEEALLEL